MKIERNLMTSDIFTLSIKDILILIFKGKIEGSAIIIKRKLS